MKHSVKWLLSWALSVVVPTRVWEKLCEYGAGHRYTTAILHSDDQSSFVLDPTSRCLGCNKPMSENVYGSLTAAYAQALLHDEAWD